MARHLHTLPHRSCTILYSFRCMRCACFPMALPTEYAVELLTFESWLFKILSLTTFFPSRIKNMQVTLTEESRSEGKVGIKAYKSYFTAGAHWFILIFLLLVTVLAQVNTDTCAFNSIFTVIFIFVLYLFIPYYCILQSTWICVEMGYLWGTK